MHFTVFVPWFLGCGLAAAVPAHIRRAVLTQVTNFGDNPAGLRLFAYLPANLATSPGVVVTLHGASGNAEKQFSDTPYAELAEQYGFVVLYPESPNGPWDATSSKSLTRDGGGASQSIANMAKYAIDAYSADVAKVAVSGISSGGSMANTVAGTYPDIFKAATIYSAGSAVDIRRLYPAYKGSYPKVQVYLGSKDRVIAASSFNKTLGVWATALGYDTTPDEIVTDSPEAGWTTYQLGSDLVGIWADGVGHPVMPEGAEDMKWWGFA